MRHPNLCPRPISVEGDSVFSPPCKSHRQKIGLLVVNVESCQGDSFVGVPPAKQAAAEFSSESHYNALRFAAASNSQRIQIALDG